MYYFKMLAFWIVFIVLSFMIIWFCYGADMWYVAPALYIGMAIGIAVVALDDMWGKTDKGDLKNENL